jgi:hypothetical protein
LKRGQTDARVAVFGIDLSLLTYQTYTRDAALLKKAIGDVGGASHNSVLRRSCELGRQADGAAASSTPQAGPGAAQAPGQSRGSGRCDDCADAAAHARAFDMLERDEQGLSTTNALLPS